METTVIVSGHIREVYDEERRAFRIVVYNRRTRTFTALYERRLWQP